MRAERCDFEGQPLLSNVGKAIKQPKLLDTVVDELATITGQQPVRKKAKKSIANFGLRQGQEIGAAVKLTDPSDRRQVKAVRAAILEILRQPSDGTPLAGRRWTQRYAARRIAWHALEHAWEMEDRSEPG